MRIKRGPGVGTVALLACLLGGCRSSAPHSHASAHPGVPDPVHLMYYEWHGVSPGAGFIRTELHASEIDFTSGLQRSISAAARRPQPLIEYPGEAPPPLLEAEPWTPMNPRDAEAIVAAARAWLATAPPDTCDSVRSRGREDGYAVRLILRTTDGTYRVRVNPPNAERPTVACHPDHATFTALLKLVAPPDMIE